MPAYPGITDRLLHELDQGTASPSEIERFFSSDPALAAKALRIVNSDYYGLSSHVDSLSQAVLILGQQQIRNLVLSVQGHTRSLPYEARATHAGLWSHTFATAVGANLILWKKRYSAAETEIAFLSGLLHDIGKLFMLSRFPTDYPALRQEAEARDIPLALLETERFGTSSAEAGRNLSKHWRFPDSLRTAIGMDPSDLNDGSEATLMAVHVADCLTSDPFEIEEAPRAIHPSAYVWLNWDENEIEWLRQEMDKRLALSIQYFEDVDEAA